MWKSGGNGFPVIGLGSRSLILTDSLLLLSKPITGNLALFSSETYLKTSIGI